MLSRVKLDEKIPSLATHSLEAVDPKARASADEPAAAQAKPAQPCAKTPRGSLMRDIQ